MLDISLYSYQGSQESGQDRQEEALARLVDEEFRKTVESEVFAIDAPDGVVRYDPVLCPDHHCTWVSSAYIQQKSTLDTVTLIF